LTNSGKPICLNVPWIFSSQEIDSHHATVHRSTDQSRNGCRMCCFCHAQAFEITRAKILPCGLPPLPIHQPTVDEFRLPAEMSIALSRAHLHARMHVASCWRRVHHRDRNQVVSRPLPVYPDQRTYSESVCTSQMCDRRTCELIDKQRLALPSGRYFIRGAATSFIPHAVNSHGCCAVEPVGEGKVK
jgi:hypothetical protein